MSNRLVVITGVGAISPLGVGAQTLHERWAAGESGIEGGVAPATEFDPAQLLSRRETRRHDRFTLLALCAANEAIEQAGWRDATPVDSDRVACVIGTGIGGLETAERAHQTWREHGPQRVSPLTVPQMMPNAAAGSVGLHHGLHGPTFGVVSACAAGADAIVTGARLVRSGEVDAAVAGGAEAPLVSLAMIAFDQLEALSRSGVCRPFDARRDGFVMGEGAGVVVLEEESVAIARGARILGRLRGFGCSGDAHHQVAPPPDGRGAVRALRRALADADCEVEEIDYINAHGTATELNDRVETTAIKTVFGDRAHKIPISAPKSAIGHLLGAAGAVETVATLMALRARVVPPTLNYGEPDDGLDLDYVPNESRQIGGNGNGSRSLIGLTTSLGFGGHNTVICLQAACGEQPGPT
jgi:3-oxoacyl-[acyl-carrier-protein] synthase II